MTTLQLNEALFRELNIIVSDEEMMKEAIKAGLPDSIKRMRGIVTFTQEEINSDDRLSYLHSK